jgi:DNA-binding NarL/FixJ family response regulator
MTIMINVFILDDHQLFIDGLIHSFTNDQLIAISGFANSGAIGIKLIELQKPDVVLLDIDFTKTKESGIDILKQIRKFNSLVKVIILTGYCDKSLVENLQKEGANGYLLKNIDFRLLHNTILGVYQGENIFRYDFFQAENKFTTVPNLTGRAIEIIQLLSQGLIIKEIASKLGIAETTVNDHLERTKLKLGAKNNVELVYMASKSGLI